MRFLLSAMLFIILCSCRNEEFATVIISGNLKGSSLPGYLVLHKASDRYGYRDWFSSVDSVVVSESGDFRFSITVTKPDFYQICDPQGYVQTPDIYLEPGDTLYVTRALINDRNVYTFSGARADAYRYFPLRDSLWQHADEFKKKDRELFYLSSVDSLNQVLSTQLKWENDLIQSHFASHPDWEPIAQQVTDERRYEVYDQYFRYLYYHNYYTRDTFLYVFPDTSFYTFLQDADLSYCPERYMWQYQTFIRSYVNDRFEHDYRELEDSLKWQNQLKLQFEVVKKHLQGVPRDAAFLALTGDFSQALKYPHFFDVLGDIEDYFSRNHTSDHYYQAFLHSSEKFKALGNGNRAPDVALPDVNGDTIRFSDLKGKVLYVDFWGTWCYPCLQELPHSLVLQEKFKDENVEFVYIGLQATSQIEEWKEFISGKRAFDYASFLKQQVYPGIHLLSEGQFGNPQIQPYMINSAPTYMLIDKEGRIAKARAPRPSSPEIEQVIAGLLH